MNRKFYIFLITLFLVSQQTNAQSVGLVLSGGGAKGLAHIGVIRVLEENNIPIDYIAGTSIGAIVGGLYAAGFTPDQMEELFRSDNFYFWTTGKIQKEFRYYFKQPESNPSWVQLRIKKKNDKLKLIPPTNLIPEEQMDFAFMEIMISTNAACKYNFDSLMIPFFCIAADINSGKPVILNKGDLGESIRASMTVPFYFKPIKIDGKLLFDGGILNNFPHDIMTDTFHPDIIIGHKVANDLKDADTDDLKQQISNLVMRPTNYEITEEEGILLKTKFDNVGLLDFNKINTILKAGTNTAELMIDSIKSRIRRRQSKKTIAQKRELFNAKKPNVYFQNIQVQGIKDPMQRRFIIQSIKRKQNLITLDEFKKEYFKLIADEHIKSIRPLSRYNAKTGYFDLHLKVVPESILEVNIGGNISTKPINQGFASINYRTYKSRAYRLSSNIYFGRFYSSFKIGGRIDYAAKLPFYLAGYSTFNRWDFFSSNTELFFQDVLPSYIIQNESNQQFEIGFPIGLHGKLFADATYVASSNLYYQTEIFSKDDEPDETLFDGFVGQIGIENYSLNYKQFPTGGKHRFITAKYVSGYETYIPGTTTKKKTFVKHNYFLLKGHTTRYFNFGKKFTLGTTVEAVFSNKKLFLNHRSTKLATPGFYPTPHSKSLFLENFHSNNYLAGGLKTIFHLKSSMHLRVEGYAFAPIFEELKNNDNTAYKNNQFFENFYFQGTAALVYQTGVGPVSLMVNYYNKRNSTFYTTLNFGYILFNKRGL
jgi:NTE family protein